MKDFYIQKTEDAKDLPLPAYMTEGSSGMDLFANVHEDTQLFPSEIKLIPTGIRISLAPGYEGQVRARSGLALNHGIGVVNSPGTVDSDYRGEIKVILINHGKEAFLIKRGDRIAQLVICPITQISFTETEDRLPQSARGGGGFGHTGLRE